MYIPLIGEVEGQAVIDALKYGLAQLEGEYKWYAVGVVLLLVTALVTKFIFKTVKWFFILALLAMVLFGGFWGLAYLAK